MRRLELGLELAADLRDAAEVDLPDLRDVRGRVDRLAHVLRRDLAHAGERVDLLADAGGRGLRRSGCRRRSRRSGRGRCRRCSGCGGDRRCRGDGRGRRGDRRGLGRGRGQRAARGPGGEMALDVLLRDAASAARADDLRDIEPVLGQHPRHDRRDEGTALGVAVGNGGRCRCRGSRSSGHGCGLRRSRGGRHLGDGSRRLGRGCGRSRRSGRGREIGREHGDPGLHIDGRALGDEDLDHHAGGRRRNLRIDLVGRDLDDRLVGLHGVSNLLEPTRDRSLGDAGPHLGHNHINRARDRHRRTSVRVEAASACTLAPLRPDRRVRPNLRP